MLGFYNYTVVLTYMGMLAAFGGILMASEKNITGSVLCLVIAGVCDMFDGPIARTMKRTEEEKRFGIQIDSLSDLVGFGILPGIILYRLTREHAAGAAIAGFYVLCALIRLAYFNVTEEKCREENHVSRTYYQGLPVTTSAILLPTVWLIQSQLRIKQEAGMMIIMFCMAVAFLLPVKVEKPHVLGKVMLSIAGACGVVLLVVGGT